MSSLIIGLEGNVGPSVSECVICWVVIVGSSNKMETCLRDTWLATAWHAVID